MADDCSEPMNSEGSENKHVLTKSILIQCEINGFALGGEKRLLFSELYEELSRQGVRREEVFEKLKLLQLQLSEATAEQNDLVAFHLGLPDSNLLGKQYLIRQTDAERLCGAVVRPHNTASDADITVNTFRVQHEIFGKSRGLFIPELYTRSSAECVTCIQCRALLSPQEFVRHNHSPLKYQVRHWGLESTRWYRYVFVAKDQPNREHFQRLLDELKQRYPLRESENVVTQPVRQTVPGESSNKVTAATSSLCGQSTDVRNVADANNNVSPRKNDLAMLYQAPMLESLTQHLNTPVTPFTEFVASAVAAAAAAAAVSSRSQSASQSLFVPPPNVKLGDMFKASPLKVADDDENNERKRPRLEPSPISSSPGFSGNTSENSGTEAALAAVAALNSHTQVQSESAAMLALPAQILLGESKPLLAEKDVAEAEEKFDETKESLLRQHLSDEITLLKKTLIDVLWKADGAKDSETKPDRELEVDRLFEKGVLDDFVKIRAKHHTQTFEQFRPGTSGKDVLPAPKHMTVMGKYLGELQEAKADLEQRVRQLTAELSRVKEEQTEASRRQMEKEREVTELRQLFSAMFSKEQSPGGYLSQALGSSASTSWQQDIHQHPTLDQRRALMLLMASEKCSSAGRLAGDSINAMLGVALASASQGQAERH